MWGTVRSIRNSCVKPSFWIIFAPQAVTLEWSSPNQGCGSELPFRESLRVCFMEKDSSVWLDWIVASMFEVSHRRFETKGQMKLRCSSQTHNPRVLIEVLLCSELTSVWVSCSCFNCPMSGFIRLNLNLMSNSVILQLGLPSTFATTLSCVSVVSWSVAVFKVSYTMKASRTASKSTSSIPSRFQTRKLIRC